jgi:hypothetical protein
MAAISSAVTPGISRYVENGELGVRSEELGLGTPLLQPETEADITMAMNAGTNVATLNLLILRIHILTPFVITYQHILYHEQNQINKMAFMGVSHDLCYCNLILNKVILRGSVKQNRVGI